MSLTQADIKVIKDLFDIQSKEIDQKIDNLGRKFQIRIDLAAAKTESNVTEKIQISMDTLERNLQGDFLSFGQKVSVQLQKMEEKLSDAFREIIEDIYGDNSMHAEVSHLKTQVHIIETQLNITQDPQLA